MATKDQYWYKILETPAMSLILSLYNHKKITVERRGGKKGWSRNRFSFEVVEPELESVTFQLTTRNNLLGIWVPTGLDINEVLLMFKPILDEAAGKDVKLEVHHKGYGRKEKARLEEEIPKVKPLASSKTVLRIVGKIDGAIGSESWHECHSRIVELRQLCIHNRTGHIPKLMDTIKRYVDTKELFENEETREELAMVMTYILENEKEAKDEKTSKEVSKQFLEPVRKIALYDRKNGLHYSLRFLGKTEVSGSVDIVADLISQRPSEITGNLESEIHYVLFGSELAKAQREYIREKLVRLSGSEEKPVRSVAMRLQKKPRLY